MARVLRKRLDHTTHFAGRFGADLFRYHLLPETRIKSAVL